MIIDYFELEQAIRTWKKLLWITYVCRYICMQPGKGWCYDCYHNLIFWFIYFVGKRQNQIRFGSKLINILISWFWKSNQWTAFLKKVLQNNLKMKQFHWKYKVLEQSQSISSQEYVLCMFVCKSIIIVKKKVHILDKYLQLYTK